MCALSVGVPGAATWVQTGYWRGNQALFARILDVNRANAPALHFVGILFGNTGTGVLADGNADDAAFLYRMVAELRPGDARAHLALGVALHRQRRAWTSR